MSIILPCHFRGTKRISGRLGTKLGQNKRCTIGVCRKPIDPLNLTQPSPICRVGSVFRAWWVGLGYKNFFYSGSGWVWVIKLQTYQTRPDPSIFNIYLKYIIYLIIYFKNQLQINSLSVPPTNTNLIYIYIYTQYYIINKFFKITNSSYLILWGPIIYGSGPLTRRESKSPSRGGL